MHRDEDGSGSLNGHQVATTNSIPNHLDISVPSTSPLLSESSASSSDDTRDQSEEEDEEEAEQNEGEGEEIWEDAAGEAMPAVRGIGRGEHGEVDAADEVEVLDDVRSASTSIHFPASIPSLPSSPNPNPEDYPTFVPPHYSSITSYVESSRRPPLDDGRNEAAVGQSISNTSPVDGPFSSASLGSSVQPRSSGPFISVASGRLGALPTNQASQTSSGRGIRSVFSNLTILRSPVPSSSPPFSPTPVQSLADIGLVLNPLSSSINLARHSQPLCGAILDDKYLLIGTTTGLLFLPLPVDGSLGLTIKVHGSHKKSTRNPISLIKKTRFKELAVLSKRSNILLAIAGRGDSIRVYSLDSIRSLIQRKVAELETHEGYIMVSDSARDVKGKSVDRSQSQSLGSSPAPQHEFELPPEYRSSVPRQPFASSSSRPPPPPPLPSLPLRRGSTASAAATIRAVPTNPPPDLFFSSPSPTASSRTVRPSTTSHAWMGSATSRGAVVGGAGGKKRVRGEPSQLTGSSLRSAGWSSIQEDVISSSSHRRRSSTPTIDSAGWLTDRSSSPLLGRGISSRRESNDITPKQEPRAAMQREGSTLDLADFIRNSGPESDLPPLPPSPPFLSTPHPTRLDSRSATVMDDRAAALEFAEFLREGPEETAGSGRDRTGARGGDLSRNASDNVSITSKSSKRWTINGVSSLFRSPQLGLESPPASPVLDPSSSSGVLSTPASPVLTTATVAPLPSHRDSKRPSAPLDRQESTEAHDFDQLAEGNANQTNSLVYAKLARTKGARKLRATETSQRTYLAVLCGDAGERIELFTGSRGISLSLNRTFVLPSSPICIEFQLQQHELVDIYLVYSDSIFGLEPTTVRVREVGVGRNERRTRRGERSPSPVPPSSEEPVGLGTTTQLHHPADPSAPPFSSMTNRAPSPRPSPAVDSEPPPVPPRIPKTPGIPYSTFQQLDAFIPNLPSAVLSSAWIIPPLYLDVIGSAPPSASIRPSVDDLPPSFDTAPLLSPVSLLGTSPNALDGPPPLFFVTRGKSLTGIVDPSGRSCIKRPIVFNKDASDESPEGAYKRIEVLLVDSGRRSAIVGLGPGQIKVVPVGPGFGDAIEVVSKGKSRDGSAANKEIHFLGKASNQLFYSESVGGHYTIYCLSAI